MSLSVPAPFGLGLGSDVATDFQTLGPDRLAGLHAQALLLSAAGGCA